MKRLLLVMFILSLISLIGVAFKIQKAKAIETIYIRADGSIDPPTPLIARNGDNYTLTGNIISDADGIVIERNNMTLDGAGYMLQGSAAQYSNGINLSRCLNVTIRNMEIRAFSNGITLDHSSDNTILGNNITNNEDGIWFFISSNNNIIGNNITENTQFGLAIIQSSNNSIIRNNIMGNEAQGFEIYAASGNVISGNTITCSGQGINMRAHSNNNTISGNNITNKYWGIYIGLSSNNRIIGNDISNNGEFGIRLESSANNNVIYHNNFINNYEQASVYYDSYDNIWDDGYPSGGNYWSDYNGKDVSSGYYRNETGSDGIGDTSYFIDADNIDNYPLMGISYSYDVFWIDPGFTVTLVSNSTVSNFDVGVWIEHPENRIIIFKVAGETGYGFGRLCIPKDLIAPPYNITIDDGQTPVLCYNDTLFDNSTHRWIYFAYLHSEHLVIIVPEFTLFPVLPLFMIATLLAVIVYKRKL